MRTTYLGILLLSLSGCVSQPMNHSRDSALLKAAENVLCSNTDKDERLALAAAVNRNEPIAEDERKGAIKAFVDDANCATVVKQSARRA